MHKDISTNEDIITEILKEYNSVIIDYSILDEVVKHDYPEDAYLMEDCDCKLARFQTIVSTNSLMKGAI